MNDNTDKTLDALFSAARAALPDTARAEFGFETRLAARIRDAALCDVQQYSWPRVRHQWEAIYASARSCAHGEMRSA